MRLLSEKYLCHSYAQGTTFACLQGSAHSAHSSHPAALLSCAAGRCPATCSPPAAGLQSLKGVPGSRLTLLRGEKETSCRAGFGNITAQAIREGGSSQHMRDSPRPVNSSQGRQPQHKLMSDFPRNSLSPQDQSFENTLAYLREVCIDPLVYREGKACRATALS